jgi:SLT domain-containing protein
MKKEIVIMLIMLILTITTAYGQAYQPLDLAKMLFGKDSLPNIENYVSGEYKGRPNGQDLQKGSTTRFTLLGQTAQTAVVGMTILDSLGKGIDTYLHFEKNTNWKMNAFRALAMTGMIEQIKEALEKMTTQQVDEIINKSKKNDKFAMFTSREDYNFQLGKAKLTLELDENIIKHFLTNQTEFERLKNVALSQLKREEVDEESSILLIEDLKTDYKRLFISSVSSGGYELGNCINFLIGGMVDNSVGYIYVNDKKHLPEMSPDRIIMIREIGNGWYIYKTT